MTYIASHGITIKCAMFLFALHALSKFEGDMHAQYGNMGCQVSKIGIWKWIYVSLVKNIYISSIFDKCSILQQTQSWLNHASYRNVYFYEFVANALGDNIG